MIQIIKATAKHAELIAKIGQQTFIQSHGSSASKTDINHFITKTYNTQKIIKEFKNRKVIYHLIYFNEKIAGFSKIVLSTSNKNVTDLNITKLDRLYLLKEFHGIQLGSKLLDFNIHLSKSNQQKGIWLAVWHENQKAIDFYEKIGFEIVGEFFFQISKTHFNPNHIMYLKY